MTNLPAVPRFSSSIAVVALNNELKELALKEQEEIEVILADLSAQAGSTQRHL